MASWSFLTNHARVLIHVSRRPDSTGLETAQAVGVTERAVRAILSDLTAAGYVSAERMGRRNRHRVDTDRPLLQFGDRELTIGDVLTAVFGEQTAGRGYERVQDVMP